MKKIFIFFLILPALIVLTSGKPQNDVKASRSERKAAKKEMVKNAIESKSYTIELERLYMYRYGAIDLIPRSNFIIIDGEKAAISAGYFGRQLSFRPIAGIRLTGQPSYYKMERNDAKGSYKVEMEVKGESDIFHIYIIINSDGNCNTTISASRIDNVRYTGTLIPIQKVKEVPEPDAIRL